MNNILLSIGVGLFQRIPTYIIVFVVLVGALGFYLWSESKKGTEIATDAAADWVGDVVLASL